MAFVVVCFGRILASFENKPDAEVLKAFVCKKLQMPCEVVRLRQRDDSTLPYIWKAEPSRSLVDLINLLDASPDLYLGVEAPHTQEEI